MSSLRVAIDVTAVPRHPTGAGHYAIEIVRALCARDDVELALVARRDDTKRWRAVTEKGTAAVHGRAPTNRVLRVAYAELGLARDVRALRPPVDVLHGPHYQAPRPGCPVVVTVHDLTFVEHPEWHERSKVVLFRRALRRAAAHADVIVCVSESTAARLRSVVAPSGAVVVAPHGVDHDRFSPFVDRADDAARRALDVTGRYVLHLGTIEPRKNVPALIRAFDAGADRDVTLVLAGEVAWGGRELARALAGARHPERIRVLGYVPEDAVAPLLRGAAAVAYPSIEEGFGLPALEALACGAPLVTTAGSVMAELAGDAAITVEPEDDTGLAEAIARLLAGDDDAAARRAAGIARAAEYTWERSASRHVAAYRMAAGR